MPWAHAHGYNMPPRRGYAYRDFDSLERLEVHRQKRGQFVQANW